MATLRALCALAQVLAVRVGSSRAGNDPYKTHTYSVPVQTEWEANATHVPLDEVLQKGSPRLKDVLDKYGFAVVTGVVPFQEQQAFEDDFKDDLLDLVDKEALSTGPEAAKYAHERLLKEGPRAFPIRTAETYLTEGAGFVLKRALMHGRFAWRARRHPNVAAVFGTLFPEEEKLVTSVDVTFFTPKGGQISKTNSFSAHVDQNKHDVRDGLSDSETYQGVLYIWPAGEGTSTTVLWPGSHHDRWDTMMEDERFKDSGKYGIHYCEIRAMYNQARGTQLAAGWAEHARRVVVPAGGLLLWNSRTLHTGWRGGPRLAQTVCLEPASRRKETARLAKLRLAALGLPSTHWAQLGMQHDMVLGYGGVFAKDRAPASAPFMFGRPLLPLLPALRPQGLADGADEGRLEKLVEVEYSTLGTWAFPGSAALLEASVRDTIKEHL
uniref:Phytanoyl-CoA dioxygenase n=1 Tax=Zooxanthella nutricula TaxID=1333877 RepID=A0A7S2NC27_9DINO